MSLKDCFYQDDWVQIYQADCRPILRGLPDESIQCCVTSPPYWGLRDYGLELVVWGGEEGCEHEWGDEFVGDTRPYGAGLGKWQHGEDRVEKGRKHIKQSQGQFCLHCNAWLGSLGLEPTPELYVEHLVEIFRMIRRVLRKDGTCWINIGDSYGAQQGKGFNTNAYTDGTNRVQDMQKESGDIKIKTGLKPKDLIGIPWRVAFALQADGWWLRSDIIWNKPNPMPESATDRPTKSHEYVFLLSKSGKYYCDMDAIREKHECLEYRPDMKKLVGKDMKKDFGAGTYGRAERHGKNQSFNPVGRNRRTVWTIPTQPCPEVHFATFPTKLIEPMIKAGSKTGDTVLDPFAGTGTVAYVAKEFGRKAIHIEPKEEYNRMAVKRVRQEVFDFNRISK